MAPVSTTVLSARSASAAADSAMVSVPCTTTSRGAAQAAAASRRARRSASVMSRLSLRMTSISSQPSRMPASFRISGTQGAPIA